ncbi:MAG: SagB/ThcOx family dehydrogenase [Phormidesmis sp.]
MKPQIKRRDLDYVVIVLLVGSTLHVFFTGLIADTMGLHHFGFHSQVGYFWMALIAMHLIQTWARVKAFVRNRFRAKSEPGALTGQPSALRPISPSPTVTQRLGTQRTGTTRRNILLAILAIATGIGFNRFVDPEENTALAEVDNDVSLLYHQWSQPGYDDAIATLLNWGKQPERYKTYPDAPQIDLPQPEHASRKGTDLATVLTERRSQRSYSTSTALSLKHLSYLLHLAQGITLKDGQFRTVPSSGALYPLEIYPIVHRVAGLDPGLYHHAVEQHKLELVKPGDLRQPLISAGLNQDFLGDAQVCFVISGIFQRTRWKYHERAYRYVLMEAGHLGQNLYLTATALGLGVCGVGAFFDDPLNKLLGIDGRTEAALYLVTVGESVA